MWPVYKPTIPNKFIMMKKSTLFLALACCFFIQCKVTKYTPDKLPTKQVIFGDGGGFTGLETSYTVLENGQIFKQIGTGKAYEELKPVKPKKAKSYFDKVASLQLYKMDIEKPGNLYFFLQEVNETIDSRVTWGAGDYLPPQGIISVYKDLHALVKGQEVLKAGEKVAAEKEEKKDDKKAGW